MKKNDLASLILLVAISFTIAYFVGNAFFNTPDNRSAEVEVITPINREFPVPSSGIFNATAINPTTDIQIDQSSSTNPFGGS